ASCSSKEIERDGALYLVAANLLDGICNLAKLVFDAAKAAANVPSYRVEDENNQACADEHLVFQKALGKGQQQIAHLAFLRIFSSFDDCIGAQQPSYAITSSVMP